MHGFKMKSYLTFRTLIAKMVGITLAIGSGLPIGKEANFFIELYVNNFNIKDFLFKFRVHSFIWVL